jgi:histidyl-tRNA synthetase
MATSEEAHRRVGRRSFLQGLKPEPAARSNAGADSAGLLKRLDAMDGSLRHPESRAPTQTRRSDTRIGDNWDALKRALTTHCWRRSFLGADRLSLSYWDSVALGSGESLISFEGCEGREFVSEGTAKKEERTRKFQAIRGVRDILPPETALWTRVEQTAHEVFATYNFGEIRLPIFESTDLFARAVGGETDIVSKEMYTFLDPPRDLNPLPRHLLQGTAEPTGTLSDMLPRDVISLRPEATASVCRAYIEHNMQQLPQPVKLYYMGPMFRRERPQKGRYRQFYQIGAEILGGPDAAGIDAEVIEMLMAFFDKVGLQGATLYINSIGHNSPNCRRGYVEKLRAELTKIKDKLGADSQRRIDTNPLRVLDSKLEHEQPYIEKLPHIADHLCDECKAHYAAVKRELDLRNVKYEENWRLVRGLDYYMRTTFEITAPGLGSQNAVCGGGRYDGLVELLGGPPTKGIGFAIGEDRLILSLQEVAKQAGGSGSGGRGHAGESLVSGHGCPVPLRGGGVGVGHESPLVYLAWMGEKAYATAIRAAKTLRNGGVRVELPPVEQKFGKALGQADKLGAQFALILGENEVQSGQWTVKTLASGEQTKLPEADLLQFLFKNRRA